LVQTDTNINSQFSMAQKLRLSTAVQTNGAVFAQPARAAQNSGRITRLSLQWWSSPWFRSTT
jgi:hypothetical protein